MYKNTKWLDKVVDAESGEVIQEGTDQSAVNFNNMENGITDAHAALALLQVMLRNELDFRNVVVLEGDVESGDTATTFSLPTGFTANNCCILSVMSTTNPPMSFQWGEENNVVAYLSKIDGTMSKLLVWNRTDSTIHVKVALQRYK